MAITTAMRTQVTQLYVSLFGRAPESSGLGYWVGQLDSGKSIQTVAQDMYNVEPARAYYPAYLTNDEIIKQFYVNVLGRSADAEGLAYWTGKLNATGATKGAVIVDMINAVTLYSGSDAAALTSKALFNNKVAAGLDYAVTQNGNDVAAATQVMTQFSTVGQTITLTTAQDTKVGTGAADKFVSRIIDNSNTLQSGDKLDGGLGNDRLDADIGNSQKFAISAETTGIETVAIRAQTIANDAANNNIGPNTNPNSTAAAAFVNPVAIDAQRMVGVTQWEDNNSRADLIIEDVRIQDNQITRDITIAMVETDPGHVDFGVYFDQYSLRANTNNSSTLRLQVMDTRSNALGTGPLKDSPYNGFAFYLGGVLVQVQTNAIDDAQTYAQLLTAIQFAIDNTAATAGKVTASLGAQFTVSDTLGALQTGTEINLNSNGLALSATGAGTGWIANGPIPPSSGLHTNMSTVATTSTDLVTAKIVLDDVGRGSTGGDLVVGGLSVGDTSSSLGVQKFEIEVRDNSKLETINSTNNTLREVTIVNGVTSSSSFAYVATVKDKGNLTVNGMSGANGVGIAAGATDAAKFGNNVDLPGAAAQTNSFGFHDVRIIDASTFVGKLAYTAELTQASIAKYLNLKDIAANPAADNIAFIYTGGLNDDTISVSLDSTAISSRNTIAAGREDFTFTANGGAGDDNITVSVVNGLNGGAQNWYTNQKLNANIFVNGGDGNDTIRTPGAGDKIIDGGAGNDTIYVDNTGALVTSTAVGNAGSSAAAYAAAAAAELALAQAAAVASNTTGFVTISGTTSGAAVTTAAAAAALDTLNLITPVAIVPGATTNAAIAAGIAAAVTAGGLTLAQAIALNVAYGTYAAAGTITPVTTLVDQTITYGAATAGDVTAAGFVAGNALLDTYITAAKTAAAAATSNDIIAPIDAALLDVTQLAVLNATQAINQVADPLNLPRTETAVVTFQAFAAPGTQTIGGLTLTATGAFTAAQAAQIAGGGAPIVGLTVTTAPTAFTVGPAVGATNVFTSTTPNANVANVDAVAPTFTGAGNAAPTAVTTDGAVGVANGTLTQVNNLATLAAALVVGATDAQVVTALQAAIANGTITTAQAANLFATVVATAGTVDATELLNTQAILTPIQTSATNANTAAQAALAAAVSANNTAVNTASNILATTAGQDPLNTSNVANDAVGVTEVNAAAAAAAGTSAAYVSGTVTPLATQSANLAALKSAITAGTTDLAVVTATQNAVANNTITGAQKIAIDAAATAVTGSVGSPVTATEKVAIDVLLTSYQLTNETLLANANLVAANYAAVATATALAAANANAAAASGGLSATVTTPTAVFVFNTADQTASYNKVTSDIRNAADLKSDVNNTYNFFNSTVKVTYKGIDASVVVAGTGFKTTDLQINQAIKNAINSDAVLSKLIVATDGPANTLVVTALIDGVHTTSNLAISVTAPAVGTLSAADIAAAGTAYGLVGATEATLIGAGGVITAAKLAFDTKGDYVTQFAESGASAGNVTTTGANSLSSSDNTITGGTGNDVIVLGTTVSIVDQLSSSNDKVVFAPGFGNDTVVNFAVAGNGIDQLDFTALNGRGNVALNSLSLDKSVVIAAEAATPLTTTQIAALFTDSATAINHVYVSYNATNIGSVYMVADAAGTAAGNVTATLVGTIDLADTGWGTLTAANFV